MSRENSLIHHLGCGLSVCKLFSHQSDSQFGFTAVAEDYVVEIKGE
jgi:hypothetical protein